MANGFESHTVTMVAICIRHWSDSSNGRASASGAAGGSTAGLVRVFSEVLVAFLYFDICD